MAEGLAYQESLGSDGTGDSLTPEALAVLVNQRLEREGNAPVFGGVRERANNGFIVEQRLGVDRG